MRNVVEEKVATQEKINDPTAKLKLEVEEKMGTSHAITLRQMDSKCTSVTSARQRRRLSWKAIDAIVEAQAIFDLNVPIEEKGTKVQYEFKVKEMALQDLDICFSVKLLQDMGMGTWGSKVILEPIRVAAAKATIITVPAAGELTFRFDNTYSWLNTKELTYCIKVVDAEQQPGAPAAETTPPSIRSPSPSNMARSTDSLASSRSSNEGSEPQSVLSVRAQYALAYRAKINLKRKGTMKELDVLSETLSGEMKQFEKLRQKHDDTRRKSR
jgi:hypothetical protein